MNDTASQNRSESMSEPSPNQANLQISLPSGIKSHQELDHIARQLAAEQLECESSDLFLEYPSRLFWTSNAQTIAVIAKPINSGNGKTNQSQFYNYFKWVMLILTLSVVVLLWNIYTVHLANQAIEQNIETLTTQVASPRKVEEQTQTRQGSGTIKTKPALDLNPLFDAVENVRLPNVQLMQFSYDASTSSMIAVYQIEHLTSIEAISKALNRAHLVSFGKNEPLNATSSQWVLWAVNDKQVQFKGVVRINP